MLLLCCPSLISLSYTSLHLLIRLSGQDEQRSSAGSGVQNAAFFDDKAKTLKEVAVKYVAELCAHAIREVLGATHSAKHLNLLDYACGVGAIALALADDFKDIVGVDVSPGSIAAMTETASSKQVNNKIHGLQISQNDLSPLEGRLFDGVIVSVLPIPSKKPITNPETALAAVRALIVSPEKR